MTETTQARRARFNAATGTPPTIAQVTAEREARDAQTKAEVDTLMDRTNRNLARRRAPDWWMRTDKHATIGGPIILPKPKPRTY